MICQTNKVSSKRPVVALCNTVAFVRVDTASRQLYSQQLSRDLHVQSCGTGCPGSGDNDSLTEMKLDFVANLDGTVSLFDYLEMQ
eukprot:scaffold1528_cov122-Cylindrotheca_fusiformis.AAC.2